MYLSNKKSQDLLNSPGINIVPKNCNNLECSELEKKVFMFFTSALVKWCVFEKKGILWFHLAKCWVINGDVWMFGFEDIVSFTKVHGEVILSQVLCKRYPFHRRILEKDIVLLASFCFVSASLAGYLKLMFTNYSVIMDFNISLVKIYLYFQKFSCKTAFLTFLNDFINS